MRAYAVQPGDSPAKIAIRFAGCPKCAIDLVRANPFKESVTYPNGFKTFKHLRVGEELRLPEKWFSKEFEELPKAYFEALPHHDGVTPSKKARVGVLGSYSALDAASMEVNALASKNDQAFTADVGPTAARIDASVLEAASSKNSSVSSLAEAVYVSTRYARTRNVDLGVALGTGDTAASTKARLDIQNALSTAVGTAHVALQALYTTPEVEIGPAIIEAPTPAPSPSPSRPKAPAPSPTPTPAPAPIAVAPTSGGLSTGAILGVSLVGAGVVGGAIYYVMNHPLRRRRIRRVNDDRPTS